MRCTASTPQLWSAQRSTLWTSEAWYKRTTPPDYRDLHLSLGFPKHLLRASEHVLFVDDWIDTGGQALGARGLVQDACATWLGAAVVVDALHDS